MVRKKQSILIAAFLLVGCLLLNFLQSCINCSWHGEYVLTYFVELLAFPNVLLVALSVLLFFRKRDTALVCVLCGYAVYSLYLFLNYAVRGHFEISNVIALLAYSSLFFLSLVLCEQTLVNKDFSKFYPLTKKLFFIPATLFGLSILSNLIDYPRIDQYNTFTFIASGLELAGILLLCKWLVTTPTPARQTTFTGKCTASQETYISTANAKHIDRTGNMNTQEIIDIIKPAICSVLKSPASAQIPTELISIVGNDMDGYEVSGFVDSQNSYGAMIRNDFTTEIAFEYGRFVVKKATVGKKASAARAKSFGLNYLAIMLLASLFGLLTYIIITASIGS